MFMLLKLCLNSSRMAIVSDWVQLRINPLYHIEGL